VVGLDPERNVRFEAEGLRITLPAGHPEVAPETGLQVRQEVRGDFEVTVRFEVLQEPLPADTGFGTRLTLGVRTQAGDTATLSRMLRKEGTLDYATFATPPKEGPEKGKGRIRFWPAAAKAGMLRLVRSGAEISYYASEGEGGAFRLLHSYPLVTDDVEAVQLVGTTGGERAALGVRFSDLRIRAESLPGLPAGPAAAEGGAPVLRGWLLATGAVVLAILVVALGVWVLARRVR
jgi:hypothetical protein